MMMLVVSLVLAVCDTVDHAPVPLVLRPVLQRPPGPAGADGSPAPVRCRRDDRASRQEAQQHVVCESGEERGLISLSPSCLCVCLFGSLAQQPRVVAEAATRLRNTQVQTREACGTQQYHGNKSSQEQNEHSACKGSRTHAWSTRPECTVCGFWGGVGPANSSVTSTQGNARGHSGGREGEETGACAGGLGQCVVCHSFPFLCAPSLALPWYCLRAVFWGSSVGCRPSAGLCCCCCCCCCP
jgi:hypothetical protein